MFNVSPAPIAPPYHGGYLHLLTLAWNMSILFCRLYMGCHGIVTHSAVYTNCLVNQDSMFTARGARTGGGEEHAYTYRKQVILA